MQLRSFIASALIAAAAPLVACSGEIDGGYHDGPYDSGDDARPEPGVVVGIWIQDHVDLEDHVLYDACDIWAETGFGCASVDRDGADILIYANEAECVDHDMDGAVVLATAYGDRTIIVETGCVARSYGGEVDERAMRVLLAHEIGHVIGLPHVPRDCHADGVRTHPASGAPICGRAVMNPYLDPAVDYMTGGDWLNFEARPSGTWPGLTEGGIVCEFLEGDPS